MSDIVWYFYFSVWLISLSIIPLRSLHGVANGKISFLMVNIPSCVYTRTHTAHARVYTHIVCVCTYICTHTLCVRVHIYVHTHYVCVYIHIVCVYIYISHIFSHSSVKHLCSFHIREYDKFSVEKMPLMTGFELSRASTHPIIPAYPEINMNEKVYG